MVLRKLRSGRATYAGVSALAGCASVLMLAGCATGPAAEPAETELPTVEQTAPAAETPTPSAEATQAASGQEVPVVINSAFLDQTAGTIEVRGTVTGVIDEGTCTATAVSADGTALSGEAAAVPDAQSTICPPITISGVTGSDWTVTLKITGDGFSGESEPLAAEVG